jgi:hypothetical protein
MRMWNMEAKVIPVIRGSTETISKSFRQYLSNIPWKHENNKKQPYWALHTYWGKC